MVELFCLLFVVGEVGLKFLDTLNLLDLSGATIGRHRYIQKVAVP